MSINDGSQRRREIGRRVARWRVPRGLTRRRFTELCGRSLSWVDKVESGERGLLRLPMLERLLTAESLFPDEIHCRPVAIELVDGLRRGSVGTRSTELHQLAKRIGLADG